MVSQMLGADWRELTDEEKAPYVEVSQKDSKRYRNTFTPCINCKDVLEY